MSYCNELKKFIVVSDTQVTGQGKGGFQEFDTLAMSRQTPTPNASNQPVGRCG